MSSTASNNSTNSTVSKTEDKVRLSFQERLAKVEEKLLISYYGDYELQILTKKAETNPVFHNQPNKCIDIKKFGSDEIITKIFPVDIGVDRFNEMMDSSYDRVVMIPN